MMLKFASQDGISHSPVSPVGYIFYKLPSIKSISVYFPTKQSSPITQQHVEKVIYFVKKGLYHTKLVFSAMRFCEFAHSYLLLNMKII